MTLGASHSMRSRHPGRVRARPLQCAPQPPHTRTCGSRQDEWHQALEGRHRALPADQHAAQGGAQLRALLLRHLCLLLSLSGTLGGPGLANGGGRDSRNSSLAAGGVGYATVACMAQQLFC